MHAARQYTPLYRSILWPGIDPVCDFGLAIEMTSSKTGLVSAKLVGRVEVAPNEVPDAFLASDLEDPDSM